MSNLQTPNCQTGVAGADLTALVNRFVAFDANKRLVLCTNANSPAVQGGPIGVNYSAVGSLRAVAFAIEGNTDVFAANTLAPGGWVTANSLGFATTAGSGDIAVAMAYQWAVPGQLARIEMCQPFRLAGSL
jgi:hypothetical protein